MTYANNMDATRNGRLLEFVDYGNSKMKQSCLFALSLFLLSATPVYSSSAVTAHVLAFGTYGNGNIYVALDQTITEAGCPLPYLELPANAPAGKTVLANAALALATGATIGIQSDACLNGVPTFTGTSRTAYFIVNKL